METILQEKVREMQEQFVRDQNKVLNDYFEYIGVDFKDLKPGECERVFDSHSREERFLHNGEVIITISPVEIKTEGTKTTATRNIRLNYLEEKINMDFGEALKALKEGKRVARKGWNGKGMFIVLHDFKGVNVVCEPGYEYEPCFVMFTAGQKWQPGWLASQADMLAEDWEVVE